MSNPFEELFGSLNTQKPIEIPSQNKLADMIKKLKEMPRNTPKERQNKIDFMIEVGNYEKSLYSTKSKN
jgi:hypothetical protein